MSAQQGNQATTSNHSHPRSHTAAMTADTELLLTSGAESNELWPYVYDYTGGCQ